MQSISISLFSKGADGPEHLFKPSKKTKSPELGLPLLKGWWIYNPNHRRLHINLPSLWVFKFFIFSPGSTWGPLVLRLQSLQKRSELIMKSKFPPPERGFTSHFLIIRRR